MRCCYGLLRPTPTMHFARLSCAGLVWSNYTNLLIIGRRLPSIFGNSKKVLLSRCRDTVGRAVSGATLFMSSYLLTLQTRRSPAKLKNPAEQFVSVKIQAL